MAVLIGRFQTRAAAWSLTGLILTALTAALVLLALNESVMSTGRIAAYGILAVAIVVYAWVGRLITVRVAGNAIGWLLLLAGLSLAVSLFGEQYALRGLATSPGSLPAVRLAGAIAWAAGLLALTLPIALVLLFPDGRLPSRRWRPVLWATYVIFAGAAAQLLQAGTAIDGGLTNALQDAGVSYPNPLGVFPRHGWFSDFLTAIVALGVITAVLAVASVFVRRRGASAERRQQLAWLGYVGVLTAVWFAVGAGYGLTTSGTGWLGTLLWALLVFTPLVGIPLACAVAVLKYRLYDLDIVVKKTVVAGLAAAAFTAIYALVVVVTVAVTGQSGNAALTFAAAALAALALQPIRARAKLLADRLVYGRRAPPYEVLSEFAGRISGAYPTEEVLPRMARMLTEATGAEQAQVWLRSGKTEHLEAAWPTAVEGREPATEAVAVAPDGRTRVFAVEHRGERLGALRIICSPREPLTPASDRLVRDVAAQAGLVVRNVVLIDDLRASRQRLVAAADDARRRLERNLHDGAQQQLVALRISAGLARQLVAESPDEAAEMLAQTEHQAADALRELRELAHGIYPPLLADLGLKAALEGHARKAALPVTVEAPAVGRYPQDIEAAIYFCVLEALQNVAKYAHASAARVALCHDGQRLAFTVEDDGMGFDQATTPVGTGLQGMSDRLAALGGTVDIASAPGHGTRITGRVPAQAR